MKIAILLVIVAAMAGLTYNAVAAFMARRATETALRENEALKARHATLREEAFELGSRAAEEIERARWMTRPVGLDRGWRARTLSTPSTTAGHDSIIAWLSAEGTQLESIAAELSVGDAATVVKQASAAAPASNGALCAKEALSPKLEARRFAPSRSAGKAAG